MADLRKTHQILVGIVLLAFAFTLRTAHAQVLLSEGFDDVAGLTGAGWAFVNTSSVPNENWAQGNDAIFPAQAGDVNSYAFSGVSATDGSSPDEIISNWMLTPSIALSNGTQISFWSRTVDVEAFPDRFEMRYSIMGESIDVGTAPTDTGDFSNLLLEINPTQTTGVYPGKWTQYTATINGLSSPTTGRIGLRHFVTNGGFAGSNGDFIGIDSLAVTAVVPETGTSLLVVFATPALFMIVRRRLYDSERRTGRCVE